MAGIIVFGVVGVACLALGFFMYRSMKATGGCSCCNHLNKAEHHDHDHDHDHSGCCCESKK